MTTKDSRENCPDEGDHYRSTDTALSDELAIEVNDGTGVAAKGVAALDDVSSSESHFGMHQAACRIRRVVPFGGLLANVYNLASATLGAGIVSVPQGFHHSGIIVSTVLILVVYICTVYSIRLIVITKDKTGLRSYEEMARGLLGRGWDYLTSFLMFIFCWGVCVGYVISVGDMLTPLLTDPGKHGFLQTSNGKRLLIGMIWLVGMFTLSLPKKINSLRYASVVGVTFIVFFVICVIVHSAQNGLKHGLRSDLKLATSGINAVNGLNLFIFAFICQVNVFEIYEESRCRTPRAMTRDSIISMGLVALLNFCAGFFGYCDFGSQVEGSLLLYYDPRHNVLFMISYIGICIKLCVGFAICIQPSRDAVYYCLRMGKTSDVKSWLNYIVSGFLALAALICGLFIPDIAIVFSLLGGICGGFLGFLFPAFFYIYSGGFTRAKVGLGNIAGCTVLLVGGVVAVVFGTAAAVYSMLP